MKHYLEKNVYEAANERIDIIFNNFERIYVSFSGGKDSSVMLNLVLDYMKGNNIKRKVGVLFIDLEGQYHLTIEYIRKMIEDNMQYIEPYWVCLPLNLRNAVSVYNPFWCCWEKRQEKNWVREMPEYDYVINEDNNTFDFFRHRMEFEEFVPGFGKWYSDGKRTACLVGIRSDESLNRYRTIVSEKKERYHGKGWTTKITDNLYNCYPIYDWTTEDVWIGNARQGWKYNGLYDMFYKAGIGIHNMRICQPYGDDQRIGLNLFRVIEPQTWSKVVNRVSGANFGNIYCGDRILGYRKVNLPKGHSWRSYTKLLLNSLPPETRGSYRQKFAKFIKYWRNNGSAVSPQNIEVLPKQAIVTDNISTRGSKNKQLVKYKRVPDHINNVLESRKLAPTWRRMAVCILKNDHLCKGLSFTQTKNQIERQKELLEKYRSL